MVWTEVVDVAVLDVASELRSWPIGVVAVRPQATTPNPSPKASQRPRADRPPTRSRPVLLLIATVVAPHAGLRGADWCASLLRCYQSSKNWWQRFPICETNDDFLVRIRSPAIEIAAIQKPGDFNRGDTTKTCLRRLKVKIPGSAQADLVCIAAISIARLGQPSPVNRSSPYDRPDRHHS
jgi:hypothetical protein